MESEINDFLLPKIKKEFPGFRLRPHTKILFTEENTKLLEKNIMKATVRYEKNTIRYPAAKRLPVIESSLTDPEHRIDRGMIEIEKIVIKKFGELNEQDAAECGYYVPDKLKAVLKKIFGNIGKNEYVSVYFFKK